MSGNALLRGYGFGIQQPPAGDRRWVPWVNAPPGTEQRLGIFYLLARTKGAEAFDAVARFTRSDRYKKLPGLRTFTSHYHIEHALEFRRAASDQTTAAGVPRGLEMPGFVKTFKARGVDIVHLGEFHVGATPRLPATGAAGAVENAARGMCPIFRYGPARIARRRTERASRRTLDELLSRSRCTGCSIAPRGIRSSKQWRVTATVYHVGSAADVLQLMEREKGLMWTAHARIKGSRGFPDQYWDTPFFRSDRFLGAAWKAMPADLSQPRLGSRVLDLLDDMSNAGRKKFVARGSRPVSGWSRITSRMPT